MAYMVSVISHGSTHLISEREKLEFESVPEFVREPRATTRDSYTSNIATSSEDIDVRPSSRNSTPPQQQPLNSPLLPKSAELEALWPGVSHEFLHSSSKKGPSFYLTAGFIAGSICTLLVLGGFSTVSRMLSANPNGGKEIVVTQGSTGSSANSQRTGSGSTLTTTSGEPEVIVPLSASYEVGPGDTLAAIALKNYKRATPRLLDEICKANNMRNANVLSLGQKLALPEYRPQATQAAIGANPVQQQ
jgi:LysM repeat protein